MRMLENLSRSGGNSLIRFAYALALTAAVGLVSPAAAGTPVEPGVPSKPDNTTSTGRELTGPGAHPEEYKAAGSTAPAAPVKVMGSATSGTPVQPGVPSKPDNTTSTGRELTGPGAHPEEYKAAGSTAPAAPIKVMGSATSGTPVQPGVPSKPNNTTSTGRELTGPGAQPEEYKAAGSKAPIVYDTVHNVRVKPDTTTATGRAWRDSVRGTTGPTRPVAPPRRTAPRTPTEMPGSGGADPSVPGSGPAR